MNLLNPRMLAAAAMLVLASTASQATVIISNYPGAPNDGTGSTVAASTADFSKAAGFTMAAGNDYTLDSVTLRLRVNDSSASLALSLFGDVAGNPGGLALATFTVPTFALGVDDYAFVPIASFVLQDLSTYWIAATGASPTADGIEWLAESPSLTPSGLATSAGYRFSNAGVFPPTGTSSVFNTYAVNGSLVTNVPEPGTAALLGLALAGLAFSRRQSR